MTPLHNNMAAAIIISLLLPLMAATEAASANVIAADALHHATTSHRETLQKEERYEILPSADIFIETDARLGGKLSNICYINDYAGMVWIASCW